MLRWRVWHHVLALGFAWSHRAEVWRGLRRLGVPSSLQEDAVQDVFLVVYRRWEDFEGRSALQTWIYGIMLRVAKDYRRAQLRHANRMQRLAEFGAVEPGPSSSASEEVERREANRLVHGVLAALTDEHREVTVTSSLCCGSASEFPNECLIGACSCSPSNSHTVSTCTCTCATRKCFNGSTCQ